MSKLKEANAKIKKYHKHLDGQPTATEHKTKAFMLTREQIEKLLGQTEKGLDGIRLYLGIEEVTGGFKHTAHAVAIVKKGKKYDDYLPEIKPLLKSKSSKLSLTATDEQYDGIEDPSPCPVNCASPNDLNS